MLDIVRKTHIQVFMSLEIKTFPVYPLGCNCSILFSKEEKKAVVIDPGGDEDKIQKILTNEGLSLERIIHTHAHFDHCLGTSKLASMHTHSKVCMHRDDLGLYKNLPMQCSFFGIHFPAQNITEISHFLEHDEEFLLGKEKIRVIHTPGHTPGSVCFHLEFSGKSLLFSGDTLFAGSIGRTDLWGGDYGKIIDSIKERLFTLEDETLVIPGHGEETRIFEERKFNPFFN